MREREEKVNPPREILLTGEDYLPPREEGVACFLFLLLASSLVAFPTVESFASCILESLSSPAASERHGFLKILYFIVTARFSGFQPRYCRSVSARLSNGRFEFA